MLTAATAHAAAPECANDAPRAIREARTALEENNSAKDRAALLCLTEAVAALDKKLQGLSDGSLPFEGQVYSPKGFIVSKPLPKEAK